MTSRLHFALSACVVALLGWGCETPPPPDTTVGEWPPTAGLAAPALAPTTGWWRNRYALTGPDGPLAEAALALSTDPASGVLVTGALAGVRLDKEGAVLGSWALQAPVSPFQFGSFQPGVRHHWGHVLAGWSEASAASQSLNAISVVELAPDGAVLRNRRYTSPVYLRTPAVFRAQDGADLVVMGEHIARFAADGQVAWSWKYAAAGRDLIWARQAVELAGGDWVVAFEGPIVYAPILLVRIGGSDGKVVWAKDLRVRDAQHSFSNLVLDASGNVTLCAGMMQIQGAPGALVQVSSDGASAEAHTFHLWRANPAQCGRELMGRAGSVLQTKEGWACHMEATLGPEDGGKYVPTWVHLPTTGKLEAVRTSGRTSALLEDGSLLTLGRNTLGFDLTHPMHAEACLPEVGSRDLGTAPATLQDIKLTLTPLALTPAPALSFAPSSLTVLPTPALCR